MEENRALLSRIAEALERMAPPPPDLAALEVAPRLVWRPQSGGLVPAPDTGPPLALLLGVDAQKEALRANTLAFAGGAPANNALLWGVRGAGKSALVKAVVREACAQHPGLRLIEAPHEALPRLPQLLAALAELPWRIILFVDDFSFDAEDALVKGLKPALDGGLGAATGRILVYATSNRRHLVGRDARENSAEDLHWSDTAEERLALSDRFGLWLGFHALGQDGYLAIVAAYAAHFGLKIADDDLRRRALQWAMARGARSGRTAFQFIVSIAAEEGAAARF